MELKNKNILLLGAFGGVANAFLRILNDKKIKNHFVLLDKKDPVGIIPEKDYGNLDFEVVKTEISLLNRGGYTDILNEYNIGLVIDLTDMDSIPFLEITNEAGVAYLNTAMNDVKKNTDELVAYIFENQNNINNASHIIGAGMNPGNVNVWVRHGIEKYGAPQEIIHFEFDDSMSLDRPRPIITWSPLEFLTESVYNPGGFMLGANKVKKVLPNALKNLVDMKDILSSVMKLSEYPRGLPIIHEENAVLAYQYNIPSKFIYAVHPYTISQMERIYGEKGTVSASDLVYGDNINIPLAGRDFIGVILRYADKDVCFYNFVENKAVKGTNATCYQVGVGVYAALMMQLNGLPNGIYFTNDLYENGILKYISENLVIEERVFEK